MLPRPTRQHIDHHPPEAAFVAIQLVEPISSTGKWRRFGRSDCGFAYRDSRFKQAPDRYLVTAVEFELSRTPALKLDYAGLNDELAAMGITRPRARDVANAVIAIRRRKLPDPAVLGNAGSFFKNPIVPAAQALIQIVPASDRMQFEAFIENRDAGFVHAGDTVAVKIDAFDYTRYGTVPGRVLHVSRDAVHDDKRGLLFAVTVELARNQVMVEGKPVPISAGMSGSVDIRTGRRRVIEYVLSPLVQHREESLRER